jgi:hypothetical protein
MKMQMFQEITYTTKAISATIIITIIIIIININIDDFVAQSLVRTSNFRLWISGAYRHLLRNQLFSLLSTPRVTAKSYSDTLGGGY